MEACRACLRPQPPLIAFALLLTHREHAPRWQGDTGGPHSPRARTAGTEQPLEGRPAEPTVDPRFAEPGSCTAQRPRPRRGRRACGGRAAERRERVVARARAVARATHAGAGALARAVRHGRDALLPDQARPFRGRVHLRRLRLRSNSQASTKVASAPPHCTWRHRSTERQGF